MHYYQDYQSGSNNQSSEKKENAEKSIFTDLVVSFMNRVSIESHEGGTDSFMSEMNTVEKLLKGACEIACKDKFVLSKPVVETIGNTFNDELITKKFKNTKTFMRCFKEAVDQTTKFTYDLLKRQPGMP